MRHRLSRTPGNIKESLQNIGISDDEIEKIIEIIHRNVDRKL